MNHSLSNLLPALLLSALGLLPLTSSAQPKSSINVGIAGLVGPNLSATASFLEYERLLSPKMALLVRAGMADYTYDEESYTENGKPKGIDIGARLYPLANKRAKGLFVGGSLGYWTTDWTWIVDRNRVAYHKEGEGSSRALRADLETGYKFSFGTETISLMPAIHIGNYFSMETSSTYTYPRSKSGQSAERESELGFYGFISLSLKIAF